MNKIKQIPKDSYVIFRVKFMTTKQIKRKRIKNLKESWVNRKSNYPNKTKKSQNFTNF